MRKRLPRLRQAATGQPIWRNRLAGRRRAAAGRCIALGATGPILRPPGCPGTCARSSRTAATRSTTSRCRPPPTADCFARYLLRVEEIRESLKIVEQAWRKLEPGPVMVEDAKIAWPAQLSVGARRHGQLARARAQDHGPVDGVADPPLQAGHRGLPVPAGQVVLGDRVAARRARLPHGVRRRHPADAGARARAKFHQPAGDARDVRGRHGRRRDRRASPRSTR